MRKKVEIHHVSNYGTFETVFKIRKINPELRCEILKFYSNRNLYVFRIQYEKAKYDTLYSLHFRPWLPNSDIPIEVRSKYIPSRIAL